MTANLPSANPSDLVLQYRLTRLEALATLFALTPKVAICTPLVLFACAWQALNVIAFGAPYWVLIFEAYPASTFYYAQIAVRNYLKTIAEPWQIRVTPQVVSWQCGAEKGYIRWVNVFDVKQTGNYLRIDCQPNRQSALYIPLRTAGDAATAKAFARDCIAYWKIARSQVFTMQHHHPQPKFLLDHSMGWTAAALVFAAITPFGAVGWLACAVLMAVIYQPLHNAALIEMANSNASRHLSAGQWEQALADLAPVIPSFCDNVDAPQVFFQAAFANIQLQKYDEANQCIKELREREPVSERAALLQAIILIKQREPVKALAQIDSILAVTPPECDNSLLSLKTWALADAHELEAALDTSASALKRHKNDRSITINRAYALCLAGQYMQADQELEALLPHIPSSLVTTLAETHKLRAICHFAQNLPTCHTFAQEAFTLHPSDAKIATVQALSLAIQGDHTQALSLVNSAISNDPYCAEAYWVRNHIRTASGGTADRDDAAALEQLKYKNYILLANAEPGLD